VTVGDDGRDTQANSVPTEAAKHIAVALLLAAFVLALYARLLFTNRVLANGDILHYFYPYRDYAAAALREGRIPLWNPFIFTGAPFLANPQPGVLYPLHWPLSWLSVTQQIYWSAALHTGLLGLGGYALVRRWGYGALAGLVTGLTLSGSGFVGGLIGHLNQLNGVAWLPWLVLMLEQGWPRMNDSTEIRVADVPWSRCLAATAGSGLIVGLLLLAGHTQTFYINLFGAGVWLIWPLASRTTLRQPGMALRAVVPMAGIYAGGVVLGLLLAAPQLLPTLELSGLGLRAGGLSYGEASSFSLKPLHLPWTLLPSYGLVDLSVVFDTLGYSEFVAYVGLIGLILAAVGAWYGRGRAHAFGLLFTLLGFFLAAGRWNPVYYLLYELVPGFDLFRAPARWMILYTLGMAVLSGVGTMVLGRRLRSRQLQPARVAALLLLLLAGELLLAARALPHTQTTAPEAVYGLRTAPAHLLTDPLRALDPAAAPRFLSLSTLTFDPGDMADYRRILVEGEDAALDERAFEQLVIAQKSQEILAPNLPMLWRVPALDGFDGGVLPLQRYIQSLTLFVPPSDLVPDGRLREQLRQMPDSELLALFNVAYVITDKVRDLWVDDVYYDRQIGARLTAELLETDVAVPHAFEATGLGVIGFVEDPNGVLTADENRPAVRIDVVVEGASADKLTLLAGGAPGAHFADPQLDSALPGAARIVYRDVEQGRQEYLARFDLSKPTAPTGLTLTKMDDEIDVTIQAITLIDARTGAFRALLPSDRGHFELVHSGDVKVYANRDVAPRATLAADWREVAGADEALTYLQNEGGRALHRPVVEGSLPDGFQPTIGQMGRAEIVTYAPERVEIRTESAVSGLLVLADAYYPGWTATVDGEEAPVLAANYLFRGVPVPAGEHTVIMRYRSSGWAQGLLFALFGLALTILLLVVAGTRTRRAQR
jgi:hypothetical protein